MQKISIMAQAPSPMSSSPLCGLWSTRLGKKHVCEHPYDVVGIQFQEKAVEKRLRANIKRNCVKTEVVNLTCSVSTH